MGLDGFDSAILRVLQRDGWDLAEEVGLLAAPCWRRVKRLEEEGFIQGCIAMVNPKKVNL